jgi:predicted nucleic acid-binding protein
MILVDTSVWIDHLRVGEDRLDALLNGGRVLTHPFVIGELACGNIHNRAEVLKLLKNLPQAPVASQEEMLYFIANNKIMGRGIGFVDAHLMAAAAMVDTSRIWTRDKRLERVAADVNLAITGNDLQ